MIRKKVNKHSNNPDHDKKAQRLISDILARSTDDVDGRVSSYLKSRGLSGKVPESLLFHPDLYFGNGDGKKLQFDAMVAKFRRSDGTVVSLQNTYLAYDGDGKAAVDSAKMFAGTLWKGALKGSAIRLFKAESMMGVAEGTETALAVNEAINLPMWVAGSANNLSAMEFPDEVEDVAIWADHDGNDVGQQAAEKLAVRLLRKGLNVAIFTPPDPDTDWLDVLNSKGAKFIDSLAGKVEWRYPDKESGSDRAGKGRSKPSSDPDQGEIDKAVNELNEKHFVVDFGGKTCIGNEVQDPITGLPGITLSSASDLKLKYCNRYVTGDSTSAEVWLESENRRQYSGLVFSPEKDVPGFYNLFFGFAVQPKQGDCQLYWKHVRDNVCDGNEIHYQFLRKWMSHAIQKPGELPGTSVVLRGMQGTGKGVFIDFFGELFGHHFLTVYMMDQITGRFNSHLKNVLLVHANEAIWGGSKVGEGVLKGIVTDPTTPIEYKGKDIITVQNYKRLIVATNEDWAVPMGMDDRRFLVMEVNPRHKEDKMYFGAIAKQMKSGGLQALMHDLLNEDLTGFDVRTAPSSPHNFDVKLRSAGPVQQWWFEYLADFDSENAWEHDPATSVLYKEFHDWCKKQGRRCESIAIFGKSFLKMFPGVYIGKRRITKNIMPTAADPKGMLSIITRLRCYELPSLAKCRECFEVSFKAGPEIWPMEIESLPEKKPRRVVVKKKTDL